jgi:hypothetical protein
MSSFNIFNVVNELTKCVKKNYKYKYSGSNNLEINFAKSLFEIIENYIHSIDNDFECGEIVDFQSEDSDMEIDNNISDYEDELDEKKVGLVDIASNLIIFPSNW